MLILENISKSYFVTEEKINILKSIEIHKFVSYLHPFQAACCCTFSPEP